MLKTQRGKRAKRCCDLTSSVDVDGLVFGLAAVGVVLEDAAATALLVNGRHMPLVRNGVVAGPLEVMMGD